MYETTELFTVMTLGVLLMGIFVFFVAVCGVANAREELAQLKRAAASRERGRGEEMDPRETGESASLNSREDL